MLDPRLTDAEFLPQVEEAAAEAFERDEIARLRAEEGRAWRVFAWLLAAVAVGSSAIGLTIVHWWPESPPQVAQAIGDQK